jgi:hypothetical protein
MLPDFCNSRKRGAEIKNPLSTKKISKIKVTFRDMFLRIGWTSNIFPESLAIEYICPKNNTKIKIARIPLKE